MRRRFSQPYLLRDKLTLSCALILVFASISSSLLILAYLRKESRDGLLRQSRVVAEQAAQRMADLVENSRWDDVSTFIASFRDHPEILSVEIYRRDGEMVASRYFGTLQSRTAQLDSERLTIQIPILSRGQPEALALFTVSMQQLHTATFRTALFLFGINVFCLLVAVLSIYLMLQKISEPISSLLSTTKEVAETRDFSLRAAKFKNDEIGQLARSFNQMLETVENQAQEIEQQAQHLARAERMEALGLLAGGVAHDLNNLLGPMVAMPSMLCEQLQENDPMRFDLALIGESASRAASVVQDLLSLARREDCVRRPIWLNPLVNKCLESRAVQQLVHAEGGIEIIASLDESLPPIQGSPSHLLQAILNVTLNGIEAMRGKGGWLRVSTGVKHVTGEEEELLIACPADQYVCLAIEDDGCGIAGEQLRRILEPFYSSKPRGKGGSGLGLAVVYGVLEDHQAGLRVDSTVGKGTRFEIYLPISAERPLNQAETTLPGGAERVLVVDDVDAQRVLTERLLQANGYKTAAVANGREAIKRLREEDFDAVILDMVMEEGFDGLDTFREILRFKPATRCLVATGFSESNRVKEILRLGASGCLRKPFTRLDLYRALREALDTPREKIGLVS